MKRADVESNLADFHDTTYELPADWKERLPDEMRTYLVELYETRIGINTLAVMHPDQVAVTYFNWCTRFRRAAYNGETHWFLYEKHE